MTVKDFVKQKYPGAIVERCVSGQVRGMGVEYYLIWSSRKREEQFRISEGISESQAWMNARNKILNAS